MKKYRSQFLRAVALCYLAFPVVYLILAILFFDVPVTKLAPLMLSPFFYFLCGWAMLAGYGLWEMRRWNWYLFCFVNFLILYQNADIVAHYAETHHRALSFVFSAVILGAVMLRITQELRVPYFLPKIRWWESNSVYQFAIPVGLMRDNGEMVSGHILDWSMRGCFIRTKEFFTEDETLSLAVHIFGQIIRWKGVVVWKTRTTVTLPNGVGIKFLPIPRAKRKKLKIAESRVRKLLELYRRSGSAENREEFLRKLDEIRNAEVVRDYFDLPETSTRKDTREILAIEKGNLSGR